MKRQDLINIIKENVDENDNIGFYLILKNNDKDKFDRIAQGLHAFEILGLLEETQLDIHRQLKKESEPPTVIKTRYME